MANNELPRDKNMEYGAAINNVYRTKVNGTPGERDEALIALLDMPQTPEEVDRLAAMLMGQTQERAGNLKPGVETTLTQPKAGKEKAE